MVWLIVDDLRSMETKMFGKPNQLPSDQPTTSQLPLELNPNVQANKNSFIDERAIRLGQNRSPRRSKVGRAEQRYAGDVSLSLKRATVQSCLD
jgi:hypothetical protein